MHCSTEYILSKIENKPELAFVLGSGLGDIAKLYENPVTIPYDEIPGFVKTTVEGHEGKMMFGDLMGKPCVILSGRFHFYEGHAPKDIVQPIRTLKELGVKKLLLTNAAGGINFGYAPGDLMIIEDHINFAGVNPLIGPNDDNIGPRFFDMSDAYSKCMRKVIQDAADQTGTEIHSGVYAMYSGPSFETPAEIRMLRTIGTDAVGMSTVPEVIAANHCSLEVAAISCITNMAAGMIRDAKLNHEEVMETGRMVKDKMTKLILKIIELL